jgi:hypothetical protein
MALIDIYDPTFWAQETLMQLYPKQIFANLVYGQFENIVANQGDTINTRLPATMAARNVDSTWVGVEPSAVNVQIKMDQWKEVQFKIGDKTASLSIKDLRAEYFQPAAEALTVAIEEALIGLYKDIGNYTGTAGSTPDDMAELGTNIKQAMDELYIPNSQRYVVLNPAAENKYHQVFANAQTAVSPQFSQIEGALSRRFGFDYFGSPLMPTHTAGEGETGTVVGVNAVVSGANAIPAPVQTLKLASVGASKDIKQGDILEIATGPAKGSYAIAEDVTTEADETVTVKLTTPLKGATAGNEVVSWIPTHAVNLAFHRQAFALVSRPLEVPRAPGANVVVIPFNGLALRVSIWYDGNVKATKVCLDILFGVKTLDARKAVRVLG